MSVSPELKEARNTTRDLVRVLLGKPVEVEGTESPSIVLLASLSVKANPELAEDAAGQAIAPALAKAPNRKELLAELDEAKPEVLVEYVLGRAQISTRTRYNLACYYTTLGRHAEQHRDGVYELALASLDLALAAGGLTEWAKEDPSLRALRAERAKEFEAIVARHTIAPEAGGGDEGAAESAAPAPSPAPAAPGIDVLPLLLELIAAEEAEGAEPAGAKEAYSYLLRGKKRDVLVLESESPRLEEVEALFAAAAARDRPNPRLAIAVGSGYKGPPELPRDGLRIEFRPVAATK